MKHVITAALFVVTCSQSLTVLAQTENVQAADKAGVIGLFSGIAIGAALGGPPGAILAGAAGGWLGDQWVTRNNFSSLKAELEKTQEQLANSQAINGALQQRQLVLQQQLTDSRLLASTGRADGQGVDCCTQTEVVLHFRSSSDTIEPHYQQALQRFVAYSTAHPGRIIEVTGFADRRGDPTENLFLSQRRVEKVVKALQDLGLSGATFQTVALGEREPVSTAQSNEGNFFDRRVVLRLSGEDQPLLSSAGH